MTQSNPQRRRLPYDAYTECWYVPGETTIVDFIHPDDGLTLHHHNDETQIRTRYADAQRMTCDEAWAAANAAAHARYRKDVSEITAERFHDALNVLPPVGWTTRRGVESFRVSEPIWGDLSDIFARLGTRYFTLSDDIRLSPDIVAERVAAYVATHPARPSEAEPERSANSDRRLAGPSASQLLPKPGEAS